MTVHITTRFVYDFAETCDVLLQFEAAPIPEQQLLFADTWITKGEHFARVPAEEAIGERIWLRIGGRLQVDHTATVEMKRILTDIGMLHALPPHELPGETVHYLLDSRYCPADRFQSFVQDEFGHLEGGPRVLAIRDWIADNMKYTPGSSTENTTALDSFVERRGVCRDYAHVMITLARASAIPARYVSCYAPGVDPPDFHAVAEVFLADPAVEGGGAWHLVDATAMADPACTVKIGVGRDAADVSFMTVFGNAEFVDKSVIVTSGG